MRMTQKLAFATACLAICSVVVVKPASAIENSLSEELITQNFNSEPFIEETSKVSDSSQGIDVNNSKTKQDESWLIPILWGLGGYMIGSLVGTNKTYTKMNKGR